MDTLQDSVKSWQAWCPQVLYEGKQIFASKYKLYLPDEVTLKAEINKERELVEIEQKLGDEE